MSATTDRLVVLEAKTAPLPWPENDFYGSLTGDQFQMIFALSQAWPLLHREIHDLEAAVLNLGKENAQLHDEHRRIVSGSTALGRQMAADKAAHAHNAEQLSTKAAELAAENARLAAIVDGLPARLDAAERVCASLNPIHAGSGGRWGWFDSAALDEWRRAKVSGGDSHA